VLYSAAAATKDAFTRLPLLVRSVASDLQVAQKVRKTGGWVLLPMTRIAVDCAVENERVEFINGVDSEEALRIYRMHQTPRPTGTSTVTREPKCDFETTSTRRFAALNMVDYVCEGVSFSLCSLQASYDPVTEHDTDCDPVSGASESFC
jgi:hypothetical protein